MYSSTSARSIFAEESPEDMMWITFSSLLAVSEPHAAKLRHETAAMTAATNLFIFIDHSLSSVNSRTDECRCEK